MILQEAVQLNEVACLQTSWVANILLNHSIVWLVDINYVQKKEEIESLNELAVTLSRFPLHLPQYREARIYMKENFG